jgi:hypothetical protein
MCFFIGGPYYWSNFTDNLATEADLEAIVTSLQLTNVQDEDGHLSYNDDIVTFETTNGPINSWCEVAIGNLELCITNNFVKPFFINIDEKPRCVARSGECCSRSDQCGPGEGLCASDIQCSSGPDGIGKCVEGACDTSLCSKNLGICFKSTDSCCTRSKAIKNSHDNNQIQFDDTCY